MYKGKNPSALRSQRWLADSLLALMEEKPYSKITIQEITDRSKLARQTFYQLFDSKEEILAYIIDSMLEESLKVIRQDKPYTLMQIVKQYMHLFARNESILQLMIKNNLNQIIISRTAAQMQTILDDSIPEGFNIPYPEYAFAFLSSGVAALLVRYYEQADISADELTTITYNLVKGRLFEG